jgi:predicted outer membrane repeat protein
VLDNFNDNTKTGWTDFTFVPGFGLPTEAGGQFQFKQNVSPSGGAIFSASQKTGSSLLSVGQWHGKVSFPATK